MSFFLNCCCAAKEVEQQAETCVQVAPDEEANGAMLDQLDAPPSLKLTFKDDTGAIQTFTFIQKPLGLRFIQDKVPVEITSVDDGGHADILGVKPGMLLQEIDGKDITALTFNEAWLKLRYATEAALGTMDVQFTKRKKDEEQRKIEAPISWVETGA